jgi:SAM-dependent methyltransferase
MSEREATSLDALELLTAYQQSAVVAAACLTGVADALAAGYRDPVSIATACGTSPGGTRALLGAMAALGLAEHGQNGYSLSPAGLPLARSHPSSLAEIVQKEWFFYRAWAGLPETIRDGHARIAPWRRRLDEDPETSLAFLRALDDLAGLFGSELAEVADLDGARTLLDVGGGAGSHAAALTKRHPLLRATVLDLAPVEPLTRKLHPELEFVAGDLGLPRFGLDQASGWDAVLLANVLHDHPVAACRRIVSECAGLLVPGGTLLVYEWLLDEDRDGPSPVALFALMMMVENEGGAAYTEAEIVDWLAAAGLEHRATRRGAGPIAVVAAIKH